MTAAIEYVPLFEVTDAPLPEGVYMCCRRCGEHVRTKPAGLFASHVTSWHRADVELGMIVRNGATPFRIRKDAPRMSNRRHA